MKRAFTTVMAVNRFSNLFKKSKDTDATSDHGDDKKPRMGIVEHVNLKKKVSKIKKGL